MVVTGLALYGAATLFAKYPVYATHRRITTWSRESEAKGPQHRPGRERFREWLSEVETSELEDDVRLAVAASIAANQAPVGYLGSPKLEVPLRQLGERLRKTWGYLLDAELARRAASASVGR